MEYSVLDSWARAEDFLGLSHFRVGAAVLQLSAARWIDSQARSFAEIFVKVGVALSIFTHRAARMLVIGLGVLGVHLPVGGHYMEHLMHHQAGGDTLVVVASGIQLDHAASAVFSRQALAAKLGFAPNELRVIADLHAI